MIGYLLFALAGALVVCLLWDVTTSCCNQSCDQGRDCTCAVNKKG